MAEDPNMQKAFGSDRAPGTATASVTDVGANPGAFAGTNQDPVERFLTYMETRNYQMTPEPFSGPMVWWAFFRYDPLGALASYRRQYGVDFPIDKCNAAQLQKLRG
jgi:hypothetical protein